MSYENKPLWYWRYITHNEYPPKDFLLTLIKRKIINFFGQNKFADCLVDGWSKHPIEVLIANVIEFENL